MVVIDSSALLELLLRAPLAARVEERLAKHKFPIHSSHLLDIEVMQVLRYYCGIGDLSPERAQEVLRDLSNFPLIRHRFTSLASRAWKLRDLMTIYDASYVALAEHLDAPLVTCDPELRKPGHKARIEVL